jgi:hypothetical protein
LEAVGYAGQTLEKLAEFPSTTSALSTEMSLDSVLFFNGSSRATANSFNRVAEDVDGMLNEHEKKLMERNFTKIELHYEPTKLLFV